MKTITYTDNSQLWTIEHKAAALGFVKTSECYWVQIFENRETGEEFCTSRDEDATDTDPIAEFAEFVESQSQQAEPEYVEVRVMLASDLRRLCIRNNWFTRGDNAAYSRMFDRLYDADGCPVDLTTEKLVTIARDIWRHSDIRDYTIETVMAELARACCVDFCEK